MQPSFTLADAAARLIEINEHPRRRRHVRAVEPSEHQPGGPAPHTGDYEELNVFGSPTGWSRHVRKGEPLPSLPRGYSWRHMPALEC